LPADLIIKRDSTLYTVLGSQISCSKGPDNYNLEQLKKSLLEIISLS